MKLDVPIPPEMDFITIWQTPDYRPEADAPIYINEWQLLLDQARKSLQSRHAAYPAWIQRGQIEEDAAAADIQAWEWIVAEWLWIVTGEGAPPPLGSLRQRRAAVELSLQRIDAELRRGNRTHDMFRQAHMAMAFAWHLDRIEDGKPAVHFIARLNHSLRDRREAKLRSAA